MKKEIYEVSVLGVAAFLYAIIMMMGVTETTEGSNSLATSPTVTSLSNTYAFLKMK